MLKGNILLFASLFLVPACSWAQEQAEPQRAIKEHQESHESAKKAVDQQERAEDKRKKEKPQNESDQDHEGEKGSGS